MRSYWIVFILISLAGPAYGDQKMRFGVLFWHESPNDMVALEGIEEALKEKGLPFELQVRQANEDKEKIKGFLKEFRDKKSDLIFAMGTQAALLAKEVEKEIPIVFTAVTNPVVSGVVDSWDGSKNNLAGNSNWIGPDTVMKVFLMATPGLKRLGIIRSKTKGQVSLAELEVMEAYLKNPASPKVKIVEQIAENVENIQPAVEKLINSKVQAIWIPIDYPIYTNLEKILQVTKPRCLPLVSSSLKGARAGAVAGVLTDYKMLGKQAVVIAIKILEDKIPPRDIPILTMQSYQVVVNLSAAKACKYELPLSLLALADLILEEKDED